MIARLAVVTLLLQVALAPSSQQVVKGSIEGVVVRLGSNEPIEGVRVSLTKAPIALNLTRMGSSASVTTDSDGKFAFEELDAESYRLTFGSDGYVRQEYGQRVFPGQGSPIELAAGQTLKNIVVRMTPTGSVSGRVRDSDKNPLVSVPIQLVRYVYDSLGRRTLQAFGNARTNDQGEYRIYFVTPGRYYLNAGTVGYDTPAAGRSEVRESYAPRFYPGVADVREAGVIDVHSGADIRGMDLTIARQPVFRVRGRIIDSSNGQSPARVNVRLIYHNPATGQDEDFNDIKGEAAIYDKGSFEFRDVVPGSFLVTATADDPAEPVAQPVEGPGEPRLPVSQSKHTGGVRIDVVNSDLNDVLLTIAGGASISGKIAVEGPKSLPSPPAQIAVYLTPSTNGRATTVFSVFTPGTSTISSDGTFRIQNVTAGEYRIEYDSRWPPGFYLKEARLGGTDLLNRPLQFGGSESGTLDIVLSSNVAAVEGNVKSDLLVPVPAARVVLVPEKNRNRADLFRSVLTDQNGHFNIPNAVPGDYKMFAWEALEPFGYFDSEILRQSEAKGVPVHIGELSRISLDLKVIPAQ